MHSVRRINHELMPARHPEHVHSIDCDSLIQLLIAKKPDGLNI
jgi:hypothetical protein